MRYSILLIIAVVLTSCWKDETPIAKQDRVGEQTQSIAMGSTYTEVVWFDLATQSVVKERNKLEWDFTIESINNEFIIRLNESPFLLAASTNQNDISQDDDITSLTYRADEQSGLLDSLAIGKQMNDGTVFVLTRGYDNNGFERTPFFLKLITSSDPVQLQFREPGTSETFNIPLTIADREVVAINLDDQSLFELVDPKWDICFTQYVHIFYEPEYTPYLVTGALQNVDSGVLIKEIRDKSYAEVKAEDAVFTAESAFQDVIGYDWKFFDLEANLYTVDNSVTYLIQDEDGRLFKLQFIDFYNDLGERGYPLFKYEEL